MLFNKYYRNKMFFIIKHLDISLKGKKKKKKKSFGSQAAWI